MRFPKLGVLGLLGIIVGVGLMFYVVWQHIPQELADKIENDTTFIVGCYILGISGLLTIGVCATDND